MGTPVLRAILVVAAIALGLIVLSRAFETVDTTQVAVPTETPQPTVDAPPAQETPSVPPSPGGGDGEGSEPKPIGQLGLVVLNGTFEPGLAADTQVVLEDAGYNVLTTNDAQGKPYEVTEIMYGRGLVANAEQLAGQFFPGAALEKAGADAEADITIILGEDYANAQGAGGGETEESPAAEETPSA